MATTVDGLGPMPRQARGWAADQSYFTRFQIALVALILVGFIQFELRGFVDIRTVPPILHVHGAVMLAWLGLTTVQNMLAGSGQIRLHRALGWVGVALAAAVFVVVNMAVRTMVGMGVFPPFFTAPFFLALTQITSVSFALLVGLAIARRKHTQAHRRLMLGSTILITEPAFGRLLPMPLMGGWGEWTILAIQLVLVALIARHDRKAMGAVQPATLVAGGVITANHVLVNLVASLPMFAAYAASLAAH